MTREDVLKLAEEVGADCSVDSTVWFNDNELIAFANAIRNAALEEAAGIVEGGRFLHNDSLDAKFGRCCAAAIREAICKT